MVKNELNSQILTLAWSNLEKRKKNLAKKFSTEVCFLLSFRSRWQTRRDILNIMVIIIISNSIIRMISMRIFIIIIVNIIFIIFK